MTNKLITIVGPTSSGKTSLALKLCKKFNGEIVSADSRQTIKEMDVGTGKLPLTSGEVPLKVETKEDYWEIDGIPIYGYDLATAEENFSVWHYTKYAREQINQIAKRNKIPFLVGGTGFYIDATLGRTTLSSKITPKDLREKLNHMSLEELVAYFKELKIDKELDLKNRVRIQRAIETHLSSEDTEALPKMEVKQICNIGLTAEREYLYKRVDLWVETMWQNGLLDETEKLIGKYGNQNIKLQGIVYKTVLAFFDNKLTQEEAIQRIKFDLHAYIRRQQTWFKKNKDILWFDISDKDHVIKITEYLSNFLKC